MLINSFGDRQLHNIILELENTKLTGTIYIQSFINNKYKRFRVLTWQSGRIIYGGIKVPDVKTITKLLTQKLRSKELIVDLIDVEAYKNEISILAFLKKLVTKQLLTWAEINSVFRNQIVLTLEQVLPYPGQFQCNQVEFDICCGFAVANLMQDVVERQTQWLSLKPLIPSYEAVPHLQANALPKVTILAVRKHLQQWVDGERSLVNIATSLHKDPLTLAQSYWHWVQAGWVVMQDHTVSHDTLATILAVDDSPTMQAEIKRLLCDHYRVLVTGNATDALNLIYHEQISLLLLDIAMPQTDGIELCYTVRGMSQYHNLPIIMLTARDTFTDRIKGRLAGSTEYLTKPCDAQKLRQLVSKHVKNNTSEQSVI